MSRVTYNEYNFARTTSYHCLNPAFSATVSLNDAFEERVLYSRGILCIMEYTF